MEFTQLKSASLKELFIETIEKGILSGNLPIGSKLPTERELCAQMGVSRSVVNAGLNDLAKKGFVEISPRVGVIVKDYRRYGNSDILISITKYNNGNMPNREIKSFFEFKILIDTFAVDKAIDNIKDEDTQVLWNYIEGIKNGKTDYECALSAYNFNQELSVLSCNTFAPLIYNSFKEPTLLLWEKYIQIYGAESVYHYSKNLFKFILNGEKEKAIEYVKHHLSQSINGDKQIYN